MRRAQRYAHFASGALAPDKLIALQEALQVAQKVSETGGELHSLFSHPQATAAAVQRAAQGARAAIHFVEEQLSATDANVATTNGLRRSLVAAKVAHAAISSALPGNRDEAAFEALLAEFVGIASEDELIPYYQADRLDYEWMWTFGDSDQIPEAFFERPLLIID